MAYSLLEVGLSALGGDFDIWLLLACSSPCVPGASLLLLESATSKTQSISGRKLESQPLPSQGAVVLGSWDRLFLPLHEARRFTSPGLGDNMHHAFMDLTGLGHILRKLDFQQQRPALPPTPTPLSIFLTAILAALTMLSSHLIPHKLATLSKQGESIWIDVATRHNLRNERVVQMSSMLGGSGGEGESLRSMAGFRVQNHLSVSNLVTDSPEEGSPYNRPCSPFLPAAFGAGPWSSVEGQQPLLRQRDLQRSHSFPGWHSWCQASHKGPLWAQAAAAAAAFAGLDPVEPEPSRK